MEEHEQIAKWLEELKEYQKIGTVAECRKIKEKQESMEVQDKKISHFPYSTLVQNVYGKCPVCNSIQSEDNYCANCGQKLDFSIEKNTEIKY